MLCFPLRDKLRLLCANRKLCGCEHADDPSHHTLTLASPESEASPIDVAFSVAAQALKMRTSTAHLNDAKFYGKYMARFSSILGVKNEERNYPHCASFFHEGSSCLDLGDSFTLEGSLQNLLASAGS